MGSRWKGRRELCDDGVHGHLSGGIHGRGQEGAFSIVLCVVSPLSHIVSLTVYPLPLIGRGDMKMTWIWDTNCEFRSSRFNVQHTHGLIFCAAHTQDKASLHSLSVQSLQPRR